MRFFCFFLLLSLTLSCSKTNTKRSKIIHYTPENATLIIKTSNLEGLKSSFENNDFIETISKSKAFKDLKKTLEILRHLKPTGETLICFSGSKKDSLDYTIITKYSKDLFTTDSLTNYLEETVTYKNKSFKKSTIKAQAFYSIVLDSTFIVSSSKTVIENAFDTKPLNNELEKIYKTTSKDKTTSIILRANQDTFIKSFFINDSLIFKTFTNYLAVDADISQNEIYLNGITKDSDSVNSLINVFKNTIPQENQIQNIAPQNSDGFMSFTFNNYKTFQSNLAKFNQKDSIINTTTLFDNIVEVGVIYENENKAVVLKSIDVIGTLDALISEQNNLETYRQIDIFGFSNPSLFSEVFAPFISSNIFETYCILDSFFVFANNIETLQTIISNYQNKTILSEQPYFIDIKEQLSDQASLMLVTNPSALKTILKNNIDKLSKLKLEAYKSSAIQFIYDHNFAHVNAIIKKNKAKASLNSITEELNIKLEADILNTPQFVTNHLNKEKDIIVQDINNNLYLISNTGKILWKKQLHGPVIGTIEQIDIYKNGRLQLAFATPNRVYILDRNGRDVTPFPGKFNDRITQPLSIFDYDKNKKYRLLVTQGSNMLMYDVKAKTVNGFTFKKANDNIISQPQHFRIGTKDYITFKTKSKLYILDRTGKTRITPKTAAKYSSESIYLYNNKFTTTTETGDLISIDTKGNAATVNINISERHHITTTSKTLVTQSDNKISIKGRTLELDFGNYTKPQIFYLNDKIYVAITDLQSQKIYLYDSQAELIQNFPVYGNSVMSLDNIDKDRNLEFVVKGESNSLLLYQIN